METTCCFQCFVDTILALCTSKNKIPVWITTGICKQELIKMYQMTFFSLTLVCFFFPRVCLYLDYSAVKNIKCSPFNPILAKVLLQWCDCHGVNANKVWEPKCPQRGLGRISELYDLALGSQASQGKVVHINSDQLESRGSLIFVLGLSLSHIETITENHRLSEKEIKKCS